MGSRILLCSSLSLLACSVTATPVLAETCKYVDKDGHVTYSNVPIDNARKLGCVQPAPPISTDRPIEPNKARSGTTQDTVKPGGDVPPQGKAGDDRRKALIAELAREQDALGNAREALAQQEAIRFGDERNYAPVRERLKPFQDEVALHEKKAESIRQELATLK